MNQQNTAVAAIAMGAAPLTRRWACFRGMAGGAAAVVLAACGAQVGGPAAPQRKDVEISIIQQPTFSTELDN